MKKQKSHVSEDGTTSQVEGDIESDIGAAISVMFDGEDGGTVDTDEPVMGITTDDTTVTLTPVVDEKEADHLPALLNDVAASLPPEIVLSHYDNVKKIVTFTTPYAAYAISLATVNTISVLVLKAAEEDDALASMSLIGIIIYFTMSFSKGTIDAASLLTSRLKEQGDSLKVGEMVRISYAVAMGISVPVMAFFFNTRPLLNAFSVHPDIVDNVDAYFNRFAYAVPAILWLTSAQKIALGFRRSVVSMVIGMSFALSGLPVSYPLVLAGYGLPGLATGAIFSAYLTAIASTIYFRLSSQYAEYELFAPRMTDLASNLSVFLKMGIPLGIQDATEHISTLFINAFIGRWKEASLASQVTTRTNSFNSAVVGALSITAGIFVAKHLGQATLAKQEGRLDDARSAIIQAKQVSYTSVMVGCSMAMVLSAAYLTIPATLTNVFVDFSKYDGQSSGEHGINETQTRDLAHTFLSIDAVAIVSNAARVIAMGALSGYKEIILPTAISFLCTTAIALPVSTWLVFADGEEDADRSTLFFAGRMLAYLASGLMINYLLYRRTGLELERLEESIGEVPVGDTLTISPNPQDGASQQIDDVPGGSAALITQFSERYTEVVPERNVNVVASQQDDMASTEVHPDTADSDDEEANDKAVKSSWGWQFSMPSYCAIS